MLRSCRIHRTTILWRLCSYRPMKRFRAHLVSLAHVLYNRRDGFCTIFICCKLHADGLLNLNTTCYSISFSFLTLRFSFTVFRTPLSNYDAVVLLHQEKLCRTHHVLFPAEIPNDKLLQPLTGKLIIWGKPSKDFHPYMPLNGAVESLHDARERLLVNFDPTAYFLRDLKCALPKTFKLRYDSVGGDVVGLTWENSKKRRRNEADETIPDPISILKEVGDVGKGLVRGVYISLKHQSFSKLCVKILLTMLMRKIRRKIQGILWTYWGWKWISCYYNNVPS